MYNFSISSKVTSLGFPPVHTSANASFDNFGSPSSGIFISLKVWGIPTSIASFLTESTAACAASSLLIPVVSTPIAFAISPYFSIHADILNSITVGRSSAFAIPWGISYTAPSGCAIEWTIPSPTFENPIPATYWAILIPSISSKFLSATAPLRCFAINSIAFISNISDITWAPFVIYPSIAWVKASIPVAAIVLFGIVSISSASTIATNGISLGSTQTIFLFSSSRVIT